MEVVEAIIRSKTILCENKSKEKGLQEENMKKQFIAILLAAVMVFALVGCTQQEAPSQSAAPEDTASAADQGAPSSDAGAAGKEIWYSTKNASQLVHVVMANGVVAEAEALGYKGQVSVAESDAALQNDQMNNLIDNVKPAAIILNPYDSDSVADVIKKAADAQIPLAVIDNPANNAQVPLSVLFDSIASGTAAGEEAVRLLKEKYGSEKGVVVNLYGEEVSQVFRERKQGFEDVIKQYPDIELISVLGKGAAEETQSALTNTIADTQAAGKTIDLINTPTDDATLGAVEALKIADMWYPAGEDKHVMVVSHDGMGQALEYLKEGYFDSDIAVDIMGVGGYAVEILNEYTMQGKDIPTSGTYKATGNYLIPEVTFSEGANGPTVMLPPAKITKDNADNPLIWGNQS